MQVILSPVDSVANTYRALLPEGTPLEFQRILDLKVLTLKFGFFVSQRQPPRLILFASIVID
jgi:hypothetical protein